MKILSIIICALLVPTLVFAEWKPPANPNPDKILNEAWKDTRENRYEDALAKFVWFHENALKYNKALYGVRLSFALGYWRELAEVYPPAMVKLKEARDEAEKKVINGKNLKESFHDMVSINRELGDESRTKEVFTLLDSRDPESAKKVYDLAQPALINSKEYKLCGKYVDPKSEYSRFVKMFKENKTFAAENPKFGAKHLEYANKQFTNDVTTLIALLILNNRKPEAEEIAKEARKEWNDKLFHSEIEKALNGRVPVPYP